LLVDRLAERIAITSGINISEKNPQAAGEYHGFRVNLSMPLLSGGWQITLTKLSPPKT
jgi:Flp pilus assembly CpaF family ATPase